MTGLVRANIDTHNGHAGYRSPYHKTYYNTGSPNVFVNGEPAVREGDTLACGDRAAAGSPNIRINGKAAHRVLDPTTGHGTWEPSFAATGSPNVTANG